MVIDHDAKGWNMTSPVLDLNPGPHANPCVQTHVLRVLCHLSPPKLIFKLSQQFTHRDL